MFYFNYNFSKPQSMQKTFEMKFLDNYVRKRDNLKIIKVKKNRIGNKKEINFQVKKEKEKKLMKILIFKKIFK